MPAAKPVILVKRVYERPSDTDGVRVLVDRLWPRGLNKEDAQVYVWLKNVAPSNELRKWLHGHPEERKEFRKRYIEELRGGDAHQALDHLREILSNEKKITLLFASKSVDYNNATVLREVILAIKQPARAARSEPRRRKKS